MKEGKGFVAKGASETVARIIDLPNPCFPLIYPPKATGGLVEPADLRKALLAAQEALEAARSVLREMVAHERAGCLACHEQAENAIAAINRVIRTEIEPAVGPAIGGK